MWIRPLYTRIWHWVYNGRIHQKSVIKGSMSKNTDLYKRQSDKSACGRINNGRKIEAIASIVEKTEFHKCRSRLFEVILSVWLNHIDFSWCQFGAEVTQISQLRNTWTSRLICCRLWRSSRGWASAKLHNLERSGIKWRCAWRRCDEPDSLTKQQRLDCRCRQLEPNWDRLVETYVRQPTEP